MTSTAIYPGTGRRLSFGLCILSIVTSLAALPAYGQLVHELSYNNSYWMDQNLNGVPSEIYPLAAFPTTPNDQSHVYYLSSGSSPHVHQLYYNGISWADEDLTVLSGGPTAFSTVTGFSVGNYQYVYYVSDGVPNHVHQLLYNNVKWVDSDLAALSGTPQQDASFLGLVAFTTTPALHVYYVDGNSLGVHQLFSNDGTTWQDQDLTSLTGGPQLNFLACGFNIKNFQYVYFTDVNFDLHQLSYNNSTWSDTDLTVLTKTGVPVAPETRFASRSSRPRNSLKPAGSRWDSCPVAPLLVPSGVCVEPPSRVSTSRRRTVRSGMSSMDSLARFSSRHIAAYRWSPAFATAARRRSTPRAMSCNFSNAAVSFAMSRILSGSSTFATARSTLLDRLKPTVPQSAFTCPSSSSRYRPPLPLFAPPTVCVCGWPLAWCLPIPLFSVPRCSFGRAQSGSLGVSNGRFFSSRSTHCPSRSYR